MAALWQDIRYGLRMLRKSPGFTAIALVTLAIGIGANTIMFSVVNVLLLRPTQVKEPDRLVECHVRNFLGGLTYTAYLDLRDNNQVFSDLVAYDDISNEATLAQGNFTRRIIYMHVSTNYFSTLGVKPALGRPFLAEEEKPDAQAVAVLSHHLWKRRGSDPEMLGKHLLLNGVSVQVVGVAPAGFMGTSVFGPDIWVSWGCYGRVTYGRTDSDQERLKRMQYPKAGVKLMGRLKPGLSRSAAQAQLQALIPRLREQYPKRCTNSCSFLLGRLSRLAAGTGENNEKERIYLFTVSLFLMGVSAVVLLIACLNLANMLIIQGTARHREIAIRMAIGGGRWCIIRQLFIESLILAVLGGALGLVVAFWGTRILNAWVAAGQFPVELAIPLKTGLEMNVLTATLVFCMVAAVLFGLRPALRLSRRDVITDLKESGCGVLRTSPRARRFMPRGLSLVCQIALSVVLVMGAALFTHAALKTAWLNYGFSLDGKLLIKVDPIAGGYDRARSAQVYENLTEHLKSLPGIQDIALSSSFPLGEGGGRNGGLLKEYEPGVEIEEPQDSSGPPNIVLPYIYRSEIIGVNYFKAMGIPLLRGRFFRGLDSVPDAEQVVIIDESLARKLRPDGNALGCLIQYGAFYLPSPKKVIGIVPNLRTISDAKDELPCIYEPIGPDRLPANIHIRLADNKSSTALVQRLSAEIRRFDPSLPIVSVTTLEDYHRKNVMVWATGLGARLAFVFGAMALFLASLGIYAVKGYMVASRTPEFGIRKALGATHGNIMSMVFREGLVLTIAGLIIGLLLGLGTARLIRSMLYGVGPVDPLSIAVALALLGIASMLASYIPARRAAKIDPMNALRYE